MENGVAHSSTFSAIVLTTRNEELDELSQGHSLGATPLDENVAGVKLRFGELLQHRQRETGMSGSAAHVGFGTEQNVSAMRKGGKYY